MLSANSSISFALLWLKQILLTILPLLDKNNAAFLFFLYFLLSYVILKPSLSIGIVKLFKQTDLIIYVE